MASVPVRFNANEVHFNLHPDADPIAARLERSLPFNEVARLAILILACMAVNHSIALKNIANAQKVSIALASYITLDILYAASDNNLDNTTRLFKGIFVLLAATMVALSVLSLKGFLTFRQLGQSILAIQLGPIAIVFLILPSIIYRAIRQIEDLGRVRADPKEELIRWIDEFKDLYPKHKNDAVDIDLLTNALGDKLTDVAEAFHKLRRMADYNSNDPETKGPIVFQIHEILKGMVKREDTKENEKINEIIEKFKAKVYGLLEHNAVNCGDGQTMLFEELQTQYLLHFKVTASEGLEGLAKMLIVIKRAKLVQDAAIDAAYHSGADHEASAFHNRFRKVLQDKLSLPIRVKQLLFANYASSYITDGEIEIIGDEILAKTSGVDNQLAILMKYKEWREVIEKEYEEERLKALEEMIGDQFDDFVFEENESKKRKIAAGMLRAVSLYQIKEALKQFLIENKKSAVQKKCG